MKVAPGLYASVWRRKQLFKKRKQEKFLLEFVTNHEGDKADMLKKEVWSDGNRLELFWPWCRKLCLAETQPCTWARAQHPHSETWWCGSIMLWRWFHQQLLGNWSRRRTRWMKSNGLCNMKIDWRQKKIIVSYFCFIVDSVSLLLLERELKRADLSSLWINLPRPHHPTPL